MRSLKNNKNIFCRIGDFLNVGFQLVFIKFRNVQTCYGIYLTVRLKLFCTVCAENFYLLLDCWTTVPTYWNGLKMVRFEEPVLTDGCVEYSLAEEPVHKYCTGVFILEMSCCFSTDTLSTVILFHMSMINWSYGTRPYPIYLPHPNSKLQLDSF